MDAILKNGHAWCIDCNQEVEYSSKEEIRNVIVKDMSISFSAKIIIVLNAVHHYLFMKMNELI